MSTPAPDHRPTIAMTCVSAGLVGAFAGAAILWGPGGALVVGGVLVFVLGIALAWQ